MTISDTATTAAPNAPTGINHLVLHVRDIEASHTFYTRILGFRHVGTSKVAANGSPAMRFYSGVKQGKLRHHDLALLQVAHAEEERRAGTQTMHHVAFEYPTQQAFYQQLEHLRNAGVPITRLVERGATHSAELSDPDGIALELVWELPRSAWEANIEEALNTGVERDPNRPDAPSNRAS